MGRTPITDEELVLSNTRGVAEQIKAKRVAAKDEGVHDAGRPAEPTHLSAEELAIWNTTADALEQRGTLTPGDGSVLALFAQLTVEHRAERRHLNEEGRIHLGQKIDKNGHAIVLHIINPRCQVVRELERQLLAVMKELGLTPKQRANVKGAIGRPKLSPTDVALRSLNKMLGVKPS